jgi:Cu/Ag efflux protein CusF
MKKLALIAGLGLALGLGLTACQKPAPAAATVETKDYSITGFVRGFQADGKVIILEHQKIEGLMDGMTMGFELADPALGKPFKVGDHVTGTLSHGGDLYKITALKKI